MYDYVYVVYMQKFRSEHLAVSVCLSVCVCVYCFCLCAVLCLSSVFVCVRPCRFRMALFFLVYRVSCSKLDSVPVPQIAGTGIWFDTFIVNASRRTASGCASWCALTSSSVRTGASTATAVAIAIVAASVPG